MISPYGDQKYLKKLERGAFADLLWNLPEPPQTLGSLALIGGNQNTFREIVKTSEAALSSKMFSTVQTIVPGSLKSTFLPAAGTQKTATRSQISRDRLETIPLKGKTTASPSTPEFIFSPSTSSGSFAESAIIPETLKNTDFAIFLGDFSKNSITTNFITSVLVKITTPALLTRDTIDLISASSASKLLENSNLIYLASGANLQKLFHAALYPRPIFLSMPFTAFADALHKFTLTYPAKVITLFSNQLVLAEKGEIFHLPLEETRFTPLSLWTGETALKIAELSLANPKNFSEAAAAALLN